MRRALIAIVVVAIVLGVASLFVVRRQITLAWPQTNGTLQLAGLQDKVTVIRDKRGIPHIYASSAHDLFMAQGFVHAQDRFWQMEFWRRIGEGRLSELFGESQIDTDRFLRTLGVMRSAQLSQDKLDEEAVGVLEAYAQGVNAYIDQNKNRLPLEFRVLGLNGVKFTPEPWTPLNSLTWATMMAFDLGGNYESELYRAELVSRYGEAWMRELSYVPYPGDKPVIVPGGVAWNKVDSATVIPAPKGLAIGGFDGIGSNNWVIHGSKTDTGMPLLASDMHLGIQMPSIWYEIGLHCQPVGDACPYNVVGYSFASTPTVIAGHNDRIAWGVTNVNPDVQDLYIERVNPDNPNQYEVDGQWVDMEVAQDDIKVAGKDDPVPLTIRRTRHGPILNDVAYGAESNWAYGWQPLSLQWTALEGNRILHAALHLDRARNWDEFRTALDSWDAPSQNFIFADVDGNIGYQMPGLIPIRAAGDGMMPVPGWTDDYAWTDYIPYDELPHAYNPAQGYIATANNRVIGPEYPHFLGNEWDAGYRAQRIGQMIEAKDKLDIADIEAIHGDDANLVMGELIPHLRDLRLDRPEVAKARDMLLTWDLQQDMDSPEAAFAEAFWYFLPSATLADEVADKLTRDPVFFRELVKNPSAHWWNNVYTPAVETRNDVFVQALNQAYDLMVTRQGSDLSKWRWGALHTATFENQTLGKSGIGMIERLFNRGPFETAGGGDIINATAWSTDESTLFQVQSLPSMRMIVDLSDLNRSLSTNTTGQSGHPYHKHYADQIDQWRTIGYAPMYWDRVQLEKASEGTLTLLP